MDLILSLKTKGNEFIVVFLFLLSSCNSSNGSFYLRYYSLSAKDTVVFFDSVSSNVHLVEVREYGSLGDFTGKFCFRINDSIFYEINNKKDLYLRYADDVIYLSKDPNKNEYGWINLINNKFVDLPNKDSIKKIIAKDNLLFRFEKNGRIFIYDNKAILIKEKNYADFLLKNGNLNIDSLSIGTYFLKNNSLNKISDDVNEVLKGGLQGVYFITFPGIDCYSITQKTFINDYLNERIRLDSFPKDIIIP